MKRISQIFLFGAPILILLAAACAPVGEDVSALPGAIQDALTGSPTALATDTTSTAATATNTTLTPSIPVTGLDIIRLDCQYCVDNIAHAQLVIPREAKIKVIAPPELASGNNDDDDDDDDDDNGEGRRLTAELSGAAEVPGPADPDGSGTSTIRLRPEQGEVCFELKASNIGPATAAHIHEGAEGVAGPVVVPLDPAPTEGSSSGCVSNVDTALIRNILQNPQQYYVNVHNEEFPDGAIRGQLVRGNNNGDDDDDDDDGEGNRDRLGCRVIDRFRDTKLVLCRAEENTTITLNVCMEDNNCTEVQLTLQSCAGTATPTPFATNTATGTVTPIPVTISATVTGTSTTSTPNTSTPTTFTPTFIPPPTGTATSTPTVATNTPTTTSTSTSTATPTP